MNDSNRAQCAQVMRQLLPHITSSSNQRCCTLIEEMIQAAETPYDPANERMEWQNNCAVDRYKHTAAGNLRELQVIATLMHYCVTDTPITIYTDKPTQFGLNVDLHACNVGTIQVKIAKVGSYGELFISIKDIKGSPEFVAYVDNANRRLYVVVHSEILQAINVLNENEEQSGLQRAVWKHDDVEKGYYVQKEYRSMFVVDLVIPDWVTHTCHVEVLNERN